MSRGDQAQQVADWLSRLEIVEVVNTYFRSLDEKNFDAEHLTGILAADATILRPNGTSLVGIDAISSSYRTSFARFEGTQHLLTGHDVDVDGETATIRVNLVAMHVWNGADNDVNSPENFFVAGAIITGEVRRSDERWKIALLDNTNVWRAGAGFTRMERTDKA